MIINIRDRKDTVMAYLKSLFGIHLKRWRTVTGKTIDKIAGSLTKFRLGPQK
jgi:hypothetical protein